MTEEQLNDTEQKRNSVDAFFEGNWAEGAVQNILDYIEENGIYIRE